MSEDLEKTLDELGPEFSEVVARLRAAPEAEPRAGVVPVPVRFPWRRCAAVAAAASLLFAAVSVSLLTPRGEQQGVEAPLRYMGGPYSLAFRVSGNGSVLDEIKRTQNADGSWMNDFLTLQNAAALKMVDSGSVAYRKAERYLRSRGLKPLSRAEFISRRQSGGRFVCRRL